MLKTTSFCSTKIKVIMDYETATVKPLTKEETKALLFLIEQSKVINNKTTNATTNKLKTEEWRRISDEFNATVTSCRRTPQQLRLKWENLKKNSRKRNTAIQMNNIKTGGGGPDYIPPDDILDRVAALLGSTVDGFTVRFGGDAEQECSVGDELNKNALLVLPEHEAMEVQVQEAEVETNVTNNTVTPKPKKIFLDTPRASGFKRKLMKTDENRAARNLAMAEYLVVKKKVLEAKLERMLLENEKTKLEIEKLKNQ